MREPRRRRRTTTPRSPAPSPLVRWVLAPAAAVAVVAVAGLAMWALLPSLLGWHATVVMSGSMEPRLHAGDVVVARPVASSLVRVGQVLLVHDPDHPGRLRLHRLVRADDQGRLVLHGDANASDDSSRVAPSAVVGVGVLRVPSIGAPVLMARTGRYAGLALVAFVLGLAVVLSCRLPRAGAPALGRDEEAPTRSGRRRERRGRARRARLRLVGMVVGSTLLLVGVTGTVPATGAPFSRTTANPTDRWSAATYFTCVEAARGDAARAAWMLEDAAGPTAADVSGNGITGGYSSTGVTYGVSGTCNGRPAVSLDGTSGRVVGNTGLRSAPELTLEVAFKTSGTHGGPLISFTSSAPGAVDSTSMAIAVNANGTLTLGVDSAGPRSVTTTKAYNDNLWHLAVGVVGTGGMLLYVDLASAVKDPSVTSAASVTGLLTVGYANHLSLSTGPVDSFQGSVAAAACYTSSLSAAKVQAHYVSAL